MNNLLNEVTHLLKETSETPALDARVLLGHISGHEPAWVQAHPEMSLLPEQRLRMESALQEMRRGVPLPYILGRQEFFGLEFEVTPQVLIPRPETELLVERGLQFLREEPRRKNALDVGTGSGCIAISLAVNMAELHLIATDRSEKALQVAEKNAKRHKIEERIEFICCDLLPESQNEWMADLVVANLPYVPRAKLQHLPVAQHEPRLALDGGEDGLDLIRTLLKRLPGWVDAGGMILLEIEASQGKSGCVLVRGEFPLSNVRLHQDLAGKDRMIEIRLPE